MAPRVLPAAEPALGERVQPELYRSMVEMNTPVCSTLAEVREAVRGSRRSLIEAAGRQGLRIAAAGTHPFSHWRDQRVTDKPRYRNLAEDYQQVFREQVVFGCHVHVGIDDREAAIQTMNRVRPWLPVLAALTVNSPYWLGGDTGYASYRTEIWNRWPTAGMPEAFASRAEYDALVETLVATGSIREPTKLYWDVRPSTKQETLEFRVADVCMDVEEAVLVAGLVRALAFTCLQAALTGEPDPVPRPELLRAAKWRAARHGLAADLVDVLGGTARPATEMVERFLAADPARAGGRRRPRGGDRAGPGDDRPRDGRGPPARGVPADPEPRVGGGPGDLRDRPLRWPRATTRRPGEPGGPG